MKATGASCVHAGTFGFQAKEAKAWVIEPLRRLGCQEFHLLENPEDKARSKLAQQGFHVDRRLRANVAVVHKVTTDLWRPAAVGASLGKIAVGIEEPLAVNVSTGPNTVVAGATLASMFWPVQLYHMRPDSRDVHWFPTFAAKKPQPRVIRALKVLADYQQEHGVACSSRRFKRIIRGRNPPILEPEAGLEENMTGQAIHGQVQSIIHTLVAYGAVRRQGPSRHHLFEVTNVGREFLELLASLGKRHLGEVV